MPATNTPTLTINGRKVPTKDALTKLLQLANDFRAAFAGTPLEALPKSVRGDANNCIIANALNFECRIHPALDPLHGTAIFYERGQAERFIALTEQDVEPTRIHRYDLPSLWSAPLTPELNVLARAFDNGALPELVD